MMNRFPQSICTIVLTLIVVCAFLVPADAAATTAPTTTATVPPVLQACAHARIPDARFTCNLSADPGSVTDTAPNTVTCTDRSITPSDQPIVSWRWEFGDGGISAERSPRHTYTAAGEFEITLSVITLCGGSYTNRTTDHVFIYCSPPEPAFTTDVVEGTAPLTVHVTDLSVNTPENVTTWTYWFDTVHTSPQRNPVYVYTNPGTYTINQTVRKTCMVPGVSALPAATRQIMVYPAVINTAVTPNGTLTQQMTTASTPTPVPTVTGTAPVTTAVADKVSLTGTLSAITEPSGARVYIDDVLRGTTPATIPGILTGPHTLRLEREGYRNSTVIIAINGGKITEYSAALVQEPGGIAILPVIVLAVIILLILGVGAYLYLRQRAQEAWERT